MDSFGTNLVATFGTAVGDAIDRSTAAAASASGAGAAALVSLLGSPGMGVDALAIATGVTGSGAVRLVDRLERDGLLERRAGADRRSVSLWLTSAGTRRARRTLEARADAVSALLAALDEDERRALVAIAEKVLVTATTSRPTAEHLCRLCDFAMCPEEVCPIECEARRLEADG
jgi:MarR family transcriptional regulator, negative regulator of the multidrug operon emrRAB